MENNTSSANFFYEKIKEKLKQQITTGSLKKDLDSIFAKVSDGGEQKLSTDDYSLIGNISYMFGLDYTGQVNGLDSKVVKNVIARFTEIEFPADELETFTAIIHLLDINALETPREELKELVNKKIAVNAAQMITIRMGINSILKNTTFPVKFAIEIDQILKEKTYTYQQLLKVNSMIYEQINIQGSQLKSLGNLYKDKTFVNLLTIGTEYFDANKFAYIYLDCIISVKEFQARNENPPIANYLASPETIDSIVTVVKEPVEIEQLVEELVTEKFKTETIAPEDVDRFIFGIYQETLDKYITTSGEFMEAVEKVMVQEDLVQHVYKFMKANMNLNRRGIDGILPSLKSNVLSAIKDAWDNYAVKYKALAERYVAEIPEDKIYRVVTYLNDVISTLSINGSERKSHLLQQVIENQVSTYKHLHQMLALIEECDINGGQTGTYVTLRDYLMNNEADFVKLFDEVQELDVYQIKISYLQCLKDFYSVEVTDENSYETAFAIEAPVGEELPTKKTGRTKKVTTTK